MPVPVGTGWGCSAGEAEHRYSATTDAGYYNPQLAYGSGGYVHLGYEFAGIGFDLALFHRRIGK